MSGDWRTMGLPALALALAVGLLPAAQAGGPVDGLIVKLKDAPAHERLATMSATERTAQADRLQRVLQAERMTEVRSRPAGRDAQHLSYGRRLSPAEAQALADRLRARPEVEWVEPNTRERLLQAAPVPNDTYYDYVSATDPGQWWLRNVEQADSSSPTSYAVPRVQAAWALQTGQPSAVVAVLDTGITPHSDLSGRVLAGGYDFVSEVDYANDSSGRDNDPSDPGDWVTSAEAADSSSPFFGCDVHDSSWHGTVISGIVAAATHNNRGVAGVSWNGRVLPVRVAGKCGATVLDITDGMRWAAGLAVAGAPTNPNPARIINISFGGSAPCGNLYQSTINELAARGVVVVAAAGNEFGAVTRPASCSGVIGVAALARDGLKAAYSNFGPQLTIATVGGDENVDDGLLTLMNDGVQAQGAETYGNVFGTSFATPVVSGVVSLMLSTNPRLSYRQIIDGLQSTARPHVQSSSGVPACSAQASTICVCTTATCGAGILDAERAVRYAAGATLDTGNSDGGGGALGLAWLAGLALAVASLWRMRLRAARRV